MKRALATFVCGVSLLTTFDAFAWERVKAELRPGVRVVRETEETLIVQAPEVERVIVLSRSRDADCDIRVDLRWRRGGTPYRVWEATPTLRRALPLPIWGRFFSVRFLKVLRRP